ncbi:MULTISPECIES: tRNA (uridine(54)-C5)-methyltransferase TrmA [unclassified Oceanobacter]|jgi:tRNA (uracil-5-)-methyltransferase|uniref:tRNA (uridine(54)-C5)-methyltransferase TrmA n=1 Tax=unclassified Oceanobacter TaxID=2620260 RepID=UPI0027375328|nr:MULTISPECIES: tRNA (uridine(54)-C5)-methyltransferase TrmA [unclassified Oceanobacter]MDP2506645.1 tRNA (uridine(54)-C5)-methyltransferase TrmA [Oceanobacter sp. 3_MG-2023]MDP2548688.1 tRNA (uridine(54)-C5)-methyltransferase TrmA [Oceanobacter sp. 4_MG-2023]
MSDLYQPGVTPAHYPQLLEQKCQTLTQRLSEFDPPALEVFASRVTHFRLRAEFRLWHSGDRCFYAMFDPEDRKKPLEVLDFPIASEQINDLMQRLLAELQDNQPLRRKLFQVEFLTTLSGDALITLIYHKKLDADWEVAARALMARMNVAIIGRSRKQKVVLERDYVTEQLSVDGQTYRYRQIEGGFTQPNGEMNQKMLSWARRCSAGIGGDLLELYCGNGNFSIALANCFDRVMATEISKTSVAAAQVNIADNQIDNLIIARLASEDFVQALRGEKQFERLKDVDLSSYDFRTVLVDPPRAGLDDESVKQVQGYDNIIYISCNPETLQANLRLLSQTHTIQRCALFDQFPYTHHIETGVLLTRRPV